MPNIHELLNESQKKCEALSKEIEAFRDARKLNQISAESLHAVSASIQSVTKELRPIGEVRFRKYRNISLISLGVNTILLLVITILLTSGISTLTNKIDSLNKDLIAAFNDSMQRSFIGDNVNPTDVDGDIKPTTPSTSPKRQ